MKKLKLVQVKSYVLFLMLVTVSLATKAQDPASPNYIGIGIIVDQPTNINRAYALYDLLKENSISNGKDILTPKILDYVQNCPYGIEGVMYDDNVKLNLYKAGKKIKEIKCSNDWQQIFNNIIQSLDATDGYKAPEKFKKINEGKTISAYTIKIEENLPGRTSVELPKNSLLNLSGIKAKIEFYKADEPYKELKNLYGNYLNVDLKDILVIKSPDVPENFKTAIKPLLSPISKTRIFALKYLAYGAALSEKGDFATALNCFYSSLFTSDDILASIKEKAKIRGIAYNNISTIFSTQFSERKEMAKLFMLAAELNKEFANSEAAITAQDDYYKQIDKVAALCQQVEENARKARAARGLKALAAGISSLGTSLSSMNISDVSSISTIASAASNLSLTSSTYEQTSGSFLSQLSKSSDNINTESFVIDGIKTEIGKTYLPKEVVYFLTYYPNEVKTTLTDYAKDKPKLKELLNGFYGADAKGKESIIKDIYAQLVKIETVIVNFEVRKQPISEKYTSTF